MGNFHYSKSKSISSTRMRLVHGDPSTVSLSSAPLVTVPSDKPRSSADKDTMVGSKIHAGAGTSGIHRKPQQQC